MAELLLEIGCEEIPAQFVPEALAQMSAKAKEIFERDRVAFKEIKPVGTPRRLAFCVEGMAEKQESKTIEKWGPFVNQAYDGNGNPTKAAIGFAKSVGVDIAQVEKKENGKGPRLYYKTEQGGRATKEILTTVLPELMLALRFPKSMRWGSGSIRFARPVHWILAIFNGEVVDFAVDGIRSGNKTYGHRFLSPGPVEVKDCAGYFKALENASVIVDPQKRKELIKSALERKAAELGVEIYPDPDLLEEVNFLVEYPVVLAGDFDKRFLEIPAEVLIAAMRGHQRYFSLKEKGPGLKLTPHFLFVANTRTPDDKVVIAGNQKVLSARLNDAEFFYREDLKTPFERRASNLGHVVFVAGLGSYLDKAKRVEKLVDHMLDRLKTGDAETKKFASRAVRLCKADLITQMVGEFPELEGIMAGEYARAQKEPEPVWKAIREHYLPKTAGDIEQARFPQTLIGQVLSIADKLDFITAAFVTGDQPTGSADPHGIRRMANGLIYITLKFGLDYNLDELIDLSLNCFAGMTKLNPEKLRAAVCDFFFTRMKNILIEEKIEYDIANAVIGAWDGNILSASRRAAALSELRKEPGFADLFVGFRRVARIIEETGQMDESLFEYQEEKDLWQAFLGVKGTLEELIRSKKWKEAMMTLGQLKPKIDSFFDTVMVNVEDKKIKINRHSLLDNIAKEFRAIADFSQLTGGEKNT